YASAAGGDSALTGTPVSVTTTPSSPIQLTASAVATNQVNLGWINVTDSEQGVKIERAVGAFGTFSQIADVTDGSTTFQDTGTSANVAYYYRIFAHGPGGNSPLVGPVSVVTPSANPSAPLAPSSVLATDVTSSQIN